MHLQVTALIFPETLRKWPNAIFLDRICTKPYTIPPVLPGEEPVHLEKGQVVWIPVHGIHHDPKYYPEPEKFDPERFSDENKHNIHPYTYLSFGSGPRNCIGSRFALMECKTLLFFLLLNFELVPSENTNIPIKISRKSLQVIPDGGNWLGLKPLMHEIR